MRRRDFIAVAAGMAALPVVGFAQAREQHRIGYLSPGSTSTLPVALQAFRDQLRELGYREGENLIIEYRWAKQRDDQLAPLVRELIDAGVEVIVVEGHTPAIKAAKETTRTIPIVMAVSGDPVGAGLVASLAHPGGNVTGMTILTPELAAKRLEVLKEALPNLARLAVLWNAANPVKVLDWQHTEAAARALGIELQSLEVTGAADFDRVFATENGDRADALIVFGDGLINANRARILDFAGRMRLLGMYPYKEFVVEGGLMSYAPSFADLFRRAAVYVDKLLNGARPADLPVQQPTKFEFVINLKTAKALGLDVPRTLLARADEVIE